MANNIYKYLCDATYLDLLGQGSKRKLKITDTNPKLKIFLISMSNFQYFFDSKKKKKKALHHRNYFIVQAMWSWARVWAPMHIVYM